MTERGRYSAALLAAQEQLYRLRATLKPQRTAVSPSPQSSHLEAAAQSDQLPGHLGWDSIPLTDRLRKAGLAKPTPAPSTTQFSCAVGNSPPTSPPAPSQSNQTMTLFADVLLAMLTQKREVDGRLWLLLRHLDTEGRGWLSLAAVQAQLTDKQAPLFVCGKRQLRNLLRRGEGFYWVRNRERIWLRAQAKVALALGVTTVNGRPIRLPVSTLCQGMGTVRAHFYAAFHSSRVNQKKASQPLGNPISRQTVANLSSIPPRTQRLYEKRVNVTCKSNLALLQPLKSSARKEAAWQFAHAQFVYTDYSGKYGKVGRQYLAKQLPNSYRGPHVRASASARRRFNAKLKALQHQGTVGNVQPREESCFVVREKRFFHDGSRAVKAATQTNLPYLYWQDRQQDRIAHAQIWHAVSPLFFV